MNSTKYYIFAIPEIEQMILNYLDPTVDLQKIILLNKYFYKIVSNDPLYLELKELCQKLKFTPIFLPFHVPVHRKIHTRLFWLGCILGYSHAIKYLLNTYPDNIDIHEYGEYAFQLCCENGHIELAQKLYQISQSNNNLINIHADNEYAFRRSCEKGQIETAKWLYQLSQQNDNELCISAVSNYAYRYSCSRNHIEIVKWLCSLCSNYSFEIRNGDIVYSIKN